MALQALGWEQSASSSGTSYSGAGCGCCGTPAVRAPTAWAAYPQTTSSRQHSTTCGSPTGTAKVHLQLRFETEAYLVRAHIYSKRAKFSSPIPRFPFGNSCIICNLRSRDSTLLLKKTSKKSMAIKIVTTLFSE